MKWLDLFFSTCVFSRFFLELDGSWLSQPAFSDHFKVHMTCPKQWIKQKKEKNFNPLASKFCKKPQHPGFPCGPPPWYWLGGTLVNFADRTGCSAFKVLWPWMKALVARGPITPILACDICSWTPIRLSWIRSDQVEFGWVGLGQVSWLELGGWARLGQG